MKVKMILPALTEATSPLFRPVKYALFPPLGLATLAAYLDPDDEVSLVLWYKDDSTTPIYSADARKTTLRKAHHSPAEWLAHRAYLRTEESPSLLQLSPVQEGDEGLYRCRVDFKKARTRNYQVQLKVICKWLAMFLIGLVEGVVVCEGHGVGRGLADNR